MTSLCLPNESYYSDNSQIFVISHQLEMGSMFFALQYMFKANVTLTYSVPNLCIFNFLFSLFQQKPWTITGDNYFKTISF